jgi:hypothetical protein
MIQFATAVSEDKPESSILSRTRRKRDTVNSEQEPTRPMSPHLLVE